MVRAVTKVFVELYNKGLIYRDKRLVNWHPGLETAISDLEVENIEVAGHMWHLRYPLADGVTYQFPVAFDDDGKPRHFESPTILREGMYAMWHLPKNGSRWCSQSE